MSQEITFGYGSTPANLCLDKLNRHGLIAGATGTGKTVTLKVIAEQLSQAGVPVFLSDIKGDLASLAEANNSDNLQERLEATHYEDYDPSKFTLELWDILGQTGIPLRMTVSAMGPILLARLLGLNDTQTGILNVVFSVADAEGLLLIDLLDLRAMINYVGQHAKDLSGHYGNISSASIGVILRSLLVLEEQGAGNFFGEPSLEIEDFMRFDQDGRGMINVLMAEQLYRYPLMYATVLLAILSDLFENLPEVGDLEKPKLVFFFDEAHVLFDGTPKVLLDQIELTVRLIRSKGVGVFFITQNPTDIPDQVANQLGNRIQHGLRAYTPKELKNVAAAAQGFRQAADMDLEKVIQELQTGQAVVSTLQEDGTPSYAQAVMIYPPKSKVGLIDPQVKLSIMNQSSLLAKYQEAVNRESAHEQLAKVVAASEDNLKDVQTQAESKLDQANTSESNARIKELEAELAKQIKKNKTSSRRTDSEMDRFTKNMMSSVGRELGKMITRGITGFFKK